MSFLQISSVNELSASMIKMYMEDPTARSKHKTEHLKKENNALSKKKKKQITSL